MNPLRSSTVVAVVAAVLMVSGCDSGGDTNAPQTTGRTSGGGPSGVDATSPGSSAPTEPSDATEPTRPMGMSPTRTTRTTRDDSPTRRASLSQVSVADMPGFNTDWVWDKASGHHGPRPADVGSARCMRSSLTAIGGVVEYSTKYTVAGDVDDQAVLTTAVFPDERTATMAESVLSTWLSKCRVYVSQQPRVDQVSVTGDRTVATSVGTGHDRLVGFGPVQGDPNSQYFNGEGYVRDGDVLSYLVMHSIGQDYNYEDDQEPVVLGLQAAADALKSSR